MGKEKQSPSPTHKNDINIDSYENIKKKLNLPQKNEFRRPSYHEIKELDGKIQNYYYSGKLNKLSIEGVCSKYIEQTTYKQIELKNVKVILYNKKEVIDFNQLKNDIQISMCNYIQKYFTFPDSITDLISFMPDFSKEDNKITLLLWNNSKYKIIADKQDISDRKVRMDIKINRLGITKSEKNDYTAVAIVGFQIDSNIECDCESD